MLDITLIILTYNEERHIGRCLERLEALGAARVVVVDCGSTDGTQDIARKGGAEVITHPWPGNQAEQFNWALDNLDITTQWVLRLDADEYLSDNLIREIQQRLPGLPDNIAGITMRRGRMFQGKRLIHGIANIILMVRLFRFGKARYEPRIMDEHLTVDGDTVVFDNLFFDDNITPLADFIAKHDNYAAREAAMMVADEYGIAGLSGDGAGAMADGVRAKRRNKGLYARMPRYWRALGYFIYRYIIRLGFLDGRAGFEWDFFQGLWYRMLVDAKIGEIHRATAGDPARVRAYLAARYGV